MKCSVISNRRPDSGHVLILAVVITAMIGFVMASYLQLVKTQNVANMRSQAWNSAMPVIEAGIEDALAHLNANGNASLVKDGWQLAGNLYWIRRTVDPDSYYIVTIANFTGPGSPSPVVEARGYVRMPLQVVSHPQLFLANADPHRADGFLVRGVRVVAGKDALFSKGMVAKGTIDMNGNNIATDSFDSADPNHSTAGAYDPAKRKDNGDVATNSGLVNGFSVGNANIRGRVSTGPGGSVEVGANGVVGSAAWHNSGNAGIEPGYSADDMNVDFPEVSAPFNGGALMPVPGLIGTTLYAYVLTGGNYQLPSVNMSGSATMVVTGHAVLYVPGNFSMTGKSQIQIAPGGSLKLYVGDVATVGGGGIVNRSGLAENFHFYGLPGNTSIDFQGNGEFLGVIYAPNADFRLSGGGSGAEDFIGASITKTVTMNGHFNFHYDENLARVGPNRGYTVRVWNEMTPKEVGSLSLSSSSTGDLDLLILNLGLP